MKHDTKNQTPAQRITNPVWLRQQITKLVADCEESITEDQALADKARDDVRRSRYAASVDCHRHWKRQLERILTGKTSVDSDMQVLYSLADRLVNGDAAVKPRIRLVVERADGRRSEIETGDQVTQDMLDVAEDLLHTLTTGDRPPLKGLYELCAKAFGTTRDDAKERILAAAYGMDAKTFDERMRLA